MSQNFSVHALAAQIVPHAHHFELFAPTLRADVRVGGSKGGQAKGKSGTKLFVGVTSARFVQFRNTLKSPSPNPINLPGY